MIEPFDSEKQIDQVKCKPGPWDPDCFDSEKQIDQDKCKPGPWDPDCFDSEKQKDQVKSKAGPWDPDCFDSEKLIDLVKCRPGLWERDCPLERSQRLNLWKEVGSAMYVDWSGCNKAEAYDRVLYLQRKWRSLRDAYNRELRARRSGVRVNKKIYMYFKRMSFLGGFENDGNVSIAGSTEEAAVPVVSMDSLDVGNSFKIDSHHSNTSTSLQTTDYFTEGDPLLTMDKKKKIYLTEGDPLINKKKKMRKIKKKREPSMQSEPIEELDMSFMSDPEESESDKLFLLSFLPEMRQLPVHIKMWARAQIANVMQEAVTAHCNNDNPRFDSVNVKRRKSNSDSN